MLLLNTCLTVRVHEANSHANRGWERFTQKVIELVDRKKRGVVFLAWGLPAGKRCQGVDGKKHLVLKSVHPSPFSASKGWFDCGHFRKCNEWLEGRYGVGAGIDWDLGAKKEMEVVKKEGEKKFEVRIEKKVKPEEEDFDDEDALAALEEVEKGL